MSVEPLEKRKLLAVFTVNSDYDTVDANLGDGIAADVAGYTTLRAAIMEANSLAGDDTINLPADTYTLSIAGRGEDAAATGDLDVTSNVTIVGADARTTTIDAAGLDRVFDVRGSLAVLNLIGLTVTGGEATGIGEAGGGICNSFGTVTATECSVSQNISGNVGGGVYNTNNGTMAFVRSTLSENEASTNGGAIFNASVSGTVTLESSTVSGNRSGNAGGGIRSHRGTLDVLNCTITGNTADTDGGGIHNDALNGTVVNVRNTIIAGNTAGVVAADVRGPFTSVGNNLVGDVGDATGFTDDVNGDQVGGAGNPVIDPMLLPLGDYGGPTFTHALLPGSPAIDAGNNTGAPATDQRGAPRIVDGPDADVIATTDIGAFESGVLFVEAPAGGGANDVTLRRNGANLELFDNNAARTEAWTRQFGTNVGTDISEVAVTDGIVYVAGQTSGDLPRQTSAGGLDAFVRKYDSSGNEIWTHQFGSSGGDYAYGISVDASGVYVAGFTHGALPGQTYNGGEDAFVRKYDLDGNVLWTRQFDAVQATRALGISAGATGVYVTGFTWGAFDGQTNLGSADAFVRKYDSTGTEIWTRQFGSPGNEQPNGISVDASGIYVAGYTNGALPDQTNAGSNDVFVCKYDTDGNEVWTRQFGTSADDRGGPISVGASGLYVAGGTTGSLTGVPTGSDHDAFVRKYDADGNEAWTRQFGTAATDYASGVSADASGVYVTGVTAGTLPGQLPADDSGVFVRWYDSSGTERWTEQFGTPDYDTAVGISVDASGVCMAGRTDGVLPGQTSSGGINGYLRKYDLGSVVASQDLNSITQVVIEGADNTDDTITVDFDSGGTFALQDGILIDGGSGTGFDSAVIIGDGISNGSYTPDATTSGNGVVTVGSTTINFTGLEPLTVSNLDSFTFTTPGSEDVLTIDSPAAGENRISGTSDGVAFESLTFFDVANVTIDTATNDLGSPSDSVTIAPSGLETTGIQNFNIATGAVAFSPGSNLDVEVNGTTPGVDYIQLDVTGTVALGGATLNVSRGFVPNVGQIFTIIDNDDADAVTGTFAGLAEGAVFSVDGRDFAVSYAGGDGNDVVLTAVPTTLHWQGDVDNHWSTPGNWLEDQAPIDGDSLMFDNNTTGFADNFEPTNDLIGLSLETITVFDDAAGGSFTLWGNGIVLSGGVNVNGSGMGNQQFRLDSITLADSLEFTVDSMLTLFHSDILLAGHDLDIVGTRGQYYESPISGDGNVNVAAPVEFHAANTYTGQTTITGLVTLSGAGTLGDTTSGTVIDRGTLDLSSVVNQEQLTMQGSHAGLRGRQMSEQAGSVTLNTTNLTDFYGHSGIDDVFTISGTITGTAGVEGVCVMPLSASNTIVFSSPDNDYIGPTVIGTPGESLGTLMTGASGSLSAASSMNVLTDAVLDLNGFDQTIGSLAGQGNVDLGTGTLTTGGNNATTTYHGVISGSGGIVKQGTGSFVVGGENTYSGVSEIRSGHLNLASPQGTLGDTAGDTLVADGASLVVARSVVIAEDLRVQGELKGIDGTDFAGSVTLLGDSRFDVGNPNSTVTFSGPITDGGAGYGVTLFTFGDTTRTFVFSGTNDYSGRTIVSSDAALRLGSTKGIPDASFVSVNPSATLDLNDFDTTIGSLSGSGAVTLGTGTLTTGGDNGSKTFSGVISGSGGLTKEGTGTFTLSGNNTYSGATILSAGTLSIGNDYALGTGVLSIGNVAILCDSTRTLTNPVSLDGDPLFGQGGGLILTGDVTLTGDRTLSTDPGRTTGVHLRGAIGESGGSRSLTMQIEGLASVWFEGATPNTYSGETRINQGTLVVSKSPATQAIIGDVIVGDGVALARFQQQRSGMIADTAAITVNANAQYMLQSGSQETIGSLSGAGTVTVVSGGTLTVGANDASTSFDGVIEESAGSASLGKVGTGTFTLGGDNTYTGDTIVGAGGLLVEGSLVGDSDVLVNSNGTLGGTGDIDGAVTVNAGGSLAPGTSPGILSTGSVTFAATSIFAVELDGVTPGVGYDQLDVTGTVALGGTALNVSRGFLPDVGQVFTIIDNDDVDAVTGTFAGLAEGAVFAVDDRDFAVSYLGGDGNDVTLTAVPTTRSWQGDVDNNWSTPGNWLEGQTPIDGDILAFDTNTAGFANNFAPYNDLTGLDVYKLDVVDDSVAGNFTIAGNGVSLQAGLSVIGTAGNVSIGLSGITLTESLAFDLGLDTVITSPLNAHTPGDEPDLTVTAVGSVQFGAISTDGGNVSLTATQDITLNDAVTTAGGAFSVDADSDNNGSGTFSLAEAVLGAFSEREKVTASDAAQGDQFGFRVSVSGNTAIVGAPYDDDGGHSSGSAYVFTRSGDIMDAAAKTDRLRCRDR